MSERTSTMEPIAATLAGFIARVEADALPPDVRATCARMLQDVFGLIYAARRTPYVRAALASACTQGSCTAIGHARKLSPYDAALVNGTAAHGEDFDDTFEGGPVHAGAVVVPAVLAIAEERGLRGDAVMRAVAVGVELMCRMSLVAPQATHRAGFHPTAVMGAPAAAAAVAAALRLSPERITHALGIAGSLASGIIEYLADGSSTKRLHAGAAAQAGIRAALLAENGFTGPATVFEGTHGFYKAFAPSVAPQLDALTDGLGARWLAATVAFKPYACGTMTQPFVDCAIDAAARLAARGATPARIASIVSKAGEGTVHRLWEPLALKQAPPNGYAGKFSTPYCIAVGLVDGRAGLEQFTDARVHDPELRALARRIRYVVDPANEYPRRFSGHLRVELDDGTVIEIERADMRGGAAEPLSDDEIAAKFAANVRFGGGSAAAVEGLHAAVAAIVDGGTVSLRIDSERSP